MKEIEPKVPGLPFDSRVSRMNRDSKITQTFDDTSEVHETMLMHSLPAHVNASSHERAETDRVDDNSADRGSGPAGAISAHSAVG